MLRTGWVDPDAIISTRRRLRTWKAQAVTRQCRGPLPSKEVAMAVVCFRPGRVLIGVVTIGALTLPAWAALTSQPSELSLDQIESRLDVLGEQAQKACPKITLLFDQRERQRMAPTFVPAMKETLELRKKLLESADPKARVLGESMNRVACVLAAFDDPEAQAQIRAQIASADQKTALTGQADDLLAEWIRTAVDPAARRKLFDRAEQLLHAHPECEPLAGAAFDMGNEMNPAGREVHERVLKMVGATHTRVGDQARQMLAQESKMHPFEGKPIVLEGALPDGKPFSTADWKGKVILVNFWATWCNPCRQEMPRIEKAYARYHGKGLEVLGITSDTDRKALLDFLAQNPQMPWPELFDPHNRGFHPLAEKYGIESIPVLFLIDRRGILRTTEARADFEEMIPRLLEEKETSN
jgi:thiol-disulfide isomerase/thioredoxin